MPINYNGTNIDKIIYNGTELTKVVYNGTTVWEKIVGPTPDQLGIRVNYGNHDTGQFYVHVYNGSNYQIKAIVKYKIYSHTYEETLIVDSKRWEETPRLDVEGGTFMKITVDCYYNNKLFHTETETGYIDESTSTTTTTTTYANNKFTSTEGNFTYYQGGIK